MKLPLRTALLVIAGLLLGNWAGAQTAAQPRATNPRVITISTAKSALALLAGDDGRLYQISYGRPKPPTTRRNAGREDEFHPPGGNGYILEPALQVIHADGNTSTDLQYVSHETTTDSKDGDVTVTRIKLKDPAYPFHVTIAFRAYRSSDVIEQWAEVLHEEPQPVLLQRFASSAPFIKGESYWLTQFQGNYMREAELAEERLTPGIKVLDSKIAVRAHQMRIPSFLIAVNGPAQEESGEVFGGTLAWSGSFQFAFDVDWNNRLRALCGVNPLASEYRLAPGKVFTTPAMLWTWSDAGKGQVSRNFHRWGRRYGSRDAAKARPVLLNNWEATHMDFDEAKIVSLFDGAKELGVDLFLLDDGWFGNKHPRDNDRAGLGDWEVNRKKLPRGLSYLATEAANRGFEFGIWIEPEMVNPASELFEQHPDWVIRPAKRELHSGRNVRNQLILDLTRPEVQAHVRKVIDGTLAPNPGITYVKWDANRYVTQAGSPYLPADQQQNVTIDYQWALYDSMRHMAEKYPNVMAMVCAGGSGRVDYGSLRYFHSFWPSDNTDPVQRIYIQWGFGHFFPASTISAHATDMGKKPLKLAIDVAMTGAFGVDSDISNWTPADRKTVAAAVKLYKEKIRDLIMQGDLYRLQSPYDSPQAALSYVAPDRDRAVVFVYRLRESVASAVKPRGLDPAKRYRVREINLPTTTRADGTVVEATSRLGNNMVMDGAALMEEGFSAPLRRPLESAVIELTAEK